MMDVSLKKQLKRSRQRCFDYMVNSGYEWPHERTIEEACAYIPVHYSKRGAHPASIEPQRADMDYDMIRSLA